MCGRELFETGLQFIILGLHYENAQGLPDLSTGLQLYRDSSYASSCFAAQGTRGALTAPSNEQEILDK